MERNVRLDVLRVLAIVECIVAHALMAEPMDGPDYHWIMMFLPDTAGVFFMASGALILGRSRRCGWRYVWHRVASFLPEFIIFSTLYAFLNQHYCVGPTIYSTQHQLIYMFYTPTWGPGWFVLALIGLYAVCPILWVWIQNARKRDIEIVLIMWLAATLLPAVMTHTSVKVPSSAFGTLFNYAGYMLLGYYLVHWPLAERTRRFKFVIFGACILIGIVFGYFMGKSGAKWGYISEIVNGLSFNIVMISLLQFCIVMMMPERWFDNIVGRLFVKISVLSLGIYCCHWLVIQYWAIINGIDWITGTLVALGVSIPLAWLMRKIRLLLTNKSRFDNKS